MIHPLALMVFEHGHLLLCLPPESSGIGEKELMRPYKENNRRQVRQRAEEWAHPPIRWLDVSSPSRAEEPQFFFGEHRILSLEKGNGWIGQLDIQPGRDQDEVIEPASDPFIHALGECKGESPAR